MHVWDRTRHKLVGNNLVLMFIYFSGAIKSSMATSSWQDLQKNFGYNQMTVFSEEIVQHWFREKGCLLLIELPTPLSTLLKMIILKKVLLNSRHFKYLTSLIYWIFLSSERVYSSFDTCAWRSSVLMEINNKIDP